MENVKVEKADEEPLAQHGMSEQPFWEILKTTGEVDRSIPLEELPAEMVMLQEKQEAALGS